MVTNILLIILIILIGYDKIPHKQKKSVVDDSQATNESEELKKQRLQEEFDKLMEYSVGDAIESKKVN